MQQKMSPRKDHFSHSLGKTNGKGWTTKAGMLFMSNKGWYNERGTTSQHRAETDYFDTYSATLHFNNQTET